MDLRAGSSFSTSISWLLIPGNDYFCWLRDAVGLRRDPPRNPQVSSFPAPTCGCVCYTKENDNEASCVAPARGPGLLNIWRFSRCGTQEAHVPVWKNGDVRLCWGRAMVTDTATATVTAPPAALHTLYPQEQGAAASSPLPETGTHGNIIVCSSR